MNAQAQTHAQNSSPLTAAPAQHQLQFGRLVRQMQGMSQRGGHTAGDLLVYLLEAVVWLCVLRNKMVE